MPENIPPLGPLTSTERTATHESAPHGGRSSLPHPSSDLPFATGQQLFGRVIQVLTDGSALIDLAGQRLTTSTPVPLAEGQVLNVVVRGLGPVVDLELVEPPAAFSDGAYALATIREARHALAAHAPPTLDDIRALLATLERSPAAATLFHRASSALSPLPLGADADRMVERLRSAIVGSGVFFEGRLATAAESGGAAPPGPPLEHDVRTLLAELAQFARHAPEIEETRQRLAADVLARQLDVASHKVKDGELRLDIPVSIDQTQTAAHLRVKDDGHARREAGEPAGRVVELRLELPELGRVLAAITWTPGTVGTRFAVDSPEHARALQQGLDELTQRLHAVGFRHVSARVDVDPAAVADERDPHDAPGESPDDPEGPPPGGSIFRVRA